MTAPRRRWSVILPPALVLATVAGAGIWLLVVTSGWLLEFHQAHRLQTVKIERECYFLDGTVDPESERGKGLFTDEELDAIQERLRAARAKENSPAPQADQP